MATRNVVKIGDDVLTKKCKPVTEFNSKLGELLTDMAQTMYAANGVGLAASQVGILRRCVTIDVGEGLVEFVNPVIVKVSGTQRSVEGCLSCPRQWGYVTRPAKVTVKAQDRKGDWFEVTGTELMAVCLCHELDHLDGHLFVEKVEEFVNADDYEDEK